jgi:gliding motility-associated-like protein
MKKILMILAIVLSFVMNGFSQGIDCSNADPFCTNTSYLFPASVNVPSLGQVGCLYTTPNPAWYWMQVGQSGNIDIHISSGGDVDFILWGPFSSLSAACATNLMTNSGVDCSYSTAAEEDCNIPNGVSGQVYVLLITNYANISTNISFNQTGGTGTADCGIIAPPITNNGPLCVGQTLNLVVTNPTPGATYNWTGPCGFVTNVMNPTIPNITEACEGIYSLTITLNGQTSPPVTTTVIVNPLPVVGITASNNTVCNGDPSILTVTPAGTYLWNDGSSLNPRTVNPTATTTYSVTVTDANTCTGSSSITINVNQLPTVSLTANPNPICSGGEVTITANGANTYLWNDGTIINPLIIHPITTGTYSVTGTDINGCSDTESVLVTVGTGNLTSMTEVHNISCFGLNDGNANIYTVNNGVAPYTYTWSSGQNTAYVDNLTPGTYTVTIVDSYNCVLSYSIEIKEPTALSFLKSFADETCQNACNGSINLTVSGGTMPYTYLWNTGQNTSAINNLCNGEYLLHVTDSNGCVLNDTTIIYTLLNINAEFTATPNIGDINELIKFESTGTNEINQTYDWSFGDNSYGNSQNPEHYYTTSGNMEVILVITVNGLCTDTAIHFVKIKCPTAFFVPNCFTPNSDGQNEVFKVKGYGFVDFKLRIFNRWGEELILLDDIEQTWNGYFKGVQCAQGTYFYVFDGTGCDGKYYNQTGVIVLLK